MAAAFPGRTLRRAFTSGMILRKLEKEGTHIDDVPQALERLADEGYVDVVVQPTHILNGDEYDKLMAQAAPFAGRFARLSFGKPLLTAEADYRALADALLSDLPAPSEDAAVLYMGHGTGHYANAAYTQLEYLLHDLGRRDIVIGTVEGYPGFDEAPAAAEGAPGGAPGGAAAPDVGGRRPRQERSGRGRARLLEVEAGDGGLSGVLRPAGPGGEPRRAGPVRRPRRSGGKTPGGSLLT